MSRFNANGKWEVHRDRPKEPRYIRTVLWRWTQWAGRDKEEHEGFKDIFRDCYPRDFVDPPAVELTYMERDGERLVVSPELLNDSRSADRNRHTINLLLELFGECETVARDLTRLSPPAIRKVNWHMLPSGRHPWERLRDHLDEALKRRSEDTRRVIMDRQETIRSYGPTDIFIGAGGFDDYLAYVFPARKLVILESVRKDNALYVFGRDWQRVSQLSKAEVLSNRFHLARIVHSDGWKGRLARLMARPAAA